MNNNWIKRVFYGDWGLGIGDWPIPNPQSPRYLNKNLFKFFYVYKSYLY